jgi:hypothetical protein
MDPLADAFRPPHGAALSVSVSNDDRTPERNGPLSLIDQGGSDDEVGASCKRAYPRTRWNALASTTGNSQSVFGSRTLEKVSVRPASLKV